MSDKQYKTEWSFSFDQIGKKLGTMLENVGGDVEVKSANFIESADGVTSARVDLKLSMGKTTIAATENADNLFEADLEYVGEVDYAVSGDAEKVVFLGQKKSSNAVVDSFKRALKSIGKQSENLKWDVRLSPNVPLRLDIEVGVGQGMFDLSGLQLTKLDLEGGVGENNLTLPQSDTPYTLTIDGGVGETNIDVPENTALKITVDGGVGAININLPDNTAARVISDGTLGGVKVPSAFQRVAKDEGDMLDRSGTWETPGFNLAERQVVIEFDGGVGARNVRMGANVKRHEPADPVDPDAPQVV